MNKEVSKSLFSEIESIPAVMNSSYYPSLDGFRGIAIIMVIMFHLGLSSNFWYGVVFNGKAGVLIFFVLSGFLITTLCIKEKVNTKTISLKNFYIRRVLRIFPVAYLFLAVLIIFNFIFKLHIDYLNLAGAALYLMDFSSYFRKYNFSWYTGHYWSLAVEEQFYLFVPLLLKKNYRLYLLGILSIVFLLPVLILLQSFLPFLNYWAFSAFTHFFIKFQSIAVGCLFSVLMFKYAIADVFSKYKVAGNIAALILIIVIQYDDFLSLRSVFSGLAISMLAGYLIVTNLAVSNDFIFKILNSKYLKTIGVLSYSLYIWQQIFTSGDARLPFFLVKFPFNLISLVIVSCLSYYFYERFFLRLKGKYTMTRKRAAPYLNVNLPLVK